MTRPLFASLVAVSLAAVSLPALASHPPSAQKSKPKPKPSPPPAGVTEETKKLPGFGDVTIDRPKDLAKARGVVLFVSGDGGWNLGVVDMARRIADRAIVAGLSMPAWQKRTEASPSSCWYPSGELEVAAQAPPTTFRGAVSLGFCPDLEVRRPFCGSKTWKPGWDEKKHQSWLPEWTSMPEREGGGDKWIALQGLIDQVCEPQATVDFVGKVPHSKIVSLDKVGHGFSVPARWGAAFDKSVVEMLEPGSVLDAQPATVHHDEIYRSPVAVTAKLEGLDLPLEIVWPEAARAVVVFVSGDGGWAELDGQVAKGLAAKGVAVVGWNTLRYFWLEKTPDRFAKDLSRLIGALPEGLPVFAGGYSFGAETIPVVVAASANAFPALAGLAGLVLLGPGPYAAFEVSPLDWFREGGGRTAHPVAKAVASLGPLAVLCIDSRSSGESGCPEGERPGYLRVELTGGHHFGGEYDDLAARIAAFVQANSAR